MAILFSKVTLKTENETAELLVSGFPKQYSDLEGWTVFDKFMEEIDEERSIKVNVDAFLYGEGEVFIATPEEVAYMTMRREMRSDFLESRCTEYGKDNFEININPEGLYNIGSM